MAGKKTNIRYENTDTPLCVISEPILRNILKDWQTKWENKYSVRADKKEKLSYALAVLGIDVTLWLTYLTAKFDFNEAETNSFASALLFLCAILFAIVFVIIVIFMIKAYRQKESKLDIEDLIKTIEKRTE